MWTTSQTQPSRGGRAKVGEGKRSHVKILSYYSYWGENNADEFTLDTLILFILNQEWADLVQQNILEQVGVNSAWIPPPQFINSKFSTEILRIHCVNKETKNWLGRTAQNMKSLWEGSHLMFVSLKDLPKRPKLLVWIPDAFVTCNRQEVINITIITSYISIYFKNWRVSDEESCLDHRRIRFDTIKLHSKRITYRNPRRTDWEFFQTDFD